MMSEDNNWDIVNCYDDNVSTSTAINRAVNGTSRNSSVPGEGPFSTVS